MNSNAAMYEIGLKKSQSQFHEDMQFAPCLSELTSSAESMPHRRSEEKRKPCTCPNCDERRRMFLEAEVDQERKERIAPKDHHYFRLGIYEGEVLTQSLKYLHPRLITTNHDL